MAKISVCTDGYTFNSTVKGCEDVKIIFPFVAVKEKISFGTELAEISTFASKENKTPDMLEAHKAAGIQFDNRVIEFLSEKCKIENLEIEKEDGVVTSITSFSELHNLCVHENDTKNIYSLTAEIIMKFQEYILGCFIDKKK